VYTVTKFIINIVTIKPPGSDSWPRSFMFWCECFDLLAFFLSLIKTVSSEINDIMTAVLLSIESFMYACIHQIYRHHAHNKTSCHRKQNKNKSILHSTHSLSVINNF